MTGAGSLSLEGLGKSYGEAPVVSGVDLLIRPGEFVTLLGPSGCGKTTILRMVAGLVVPSTGRILVDGADITALPTHRRNMGLVFQNYALFPHMTVAGNVGFGLEMRGVARAEAAVRVREVLDLVRLGDYGARPPRQLSGGQQQRVALARALVIRPRCLLLDEPLSNLDAKLRLEMRGEIRRICREAGLTAIYVTHDQKEALSIADRLAVLQNGRILQVGAPSTVYRHPESRFVADFMGETHFLDGRIVSLAGDVASVETPLGQFEARIAGAGWSQGASVTLSIRPECWKLGAVGGGANTVAGRITDRVYLGELAQYAFTPAATPAAPLKVLELNPRFVQADASKDLFASVAADDVVILPRE